MLPTLTMGRSNRLVVALLLLFLILGPMAIEGLSSVALRVLADRFQTFVTIFLGIFIEAVPFLLAGSMVSGFIVVFVNPDTLHRFVPRRPLLAVISGAMLGLAFPVCECGVVPVTRRLYQKGLPLSVGIAFLMAAPVVNPVVIASTYAAFGWGPMLLGRVGFTFLIASAVGFLFHLARPEEVLLLELPEQSDLSHQRQAHGSADRGQRVCEALATAGDDFLDMARYLILGSLLAAGMQTLVPQATLLAVGSGSLASVFTMLALAFVLSACSTVDAFLALAFVNTFTSGAVLGFLVFGPMVDVKSLLMFLGVFRRRTVLYLVLLPLMMTMLGAVYLNLNVGW